MGKASSTKKVQRAARAGATKRSSRQRQGSLLWPAAVTLFVIVGVFLVVVSRNDRINEGAGPRPRIFTEFPEDHWHSAFGVYDCDHYLANLPEAVNSGIHTHGDGLIHVEARNRTESGDNAVLGRFLRDYGSGVALKDDELHLTGSTSLKDGTKCNGKKAELFVKVWGDKDDSKPRLLSVDDALDLRLADKQVIALGIAVDPDKVPLPDSVSELANPQSNEPGATTTTVPSSPTTTAAGGATTTSPSTPSTTAAGGATTTTASP